MIENMLPAIAVIGGAVLAYLAGRYSRPPAGVAFDWKNPQTGLEARILARRAMIASVELHQIARCLLEDDRRSMHVLVEGDGRFRLSTWADGRLESSYLPSSLEKVIETIRELAPPAQSPQSLERCDTHAR